MMDKDRFYIKIEDGKYQLYDRIEEYSFNPISEEWFVVQVKDLLNKYFKELFKLRICNGLLNDYKQEYELMIKKHPEWREENDSWVNDE